MPTLQNTRRLHLEVTNLVHNMSYKNVHLISKTRGLRLNKCPPHSTPKWMWISKKNVLIDLNH